MAKSIRYSVSAHLSNPANFFAGGLGMAMNNLIFLTGIWGMLFAGKEQNSGMVLYYISLNAMFMTAWGVVNFFCGGWIEFGELITSGEFESKLATPRHPLLLVATHALQPSAIGDLVIGFAGIGYLAVTSPPGWTLRVIIACVLSILSLISVYVAAGSLAFFFGRGNELATLVRELVVSLSSYPMGKIFPSGLGRVLLLLTPAAAVSLLPMAWVEHAGMWHFAGAACAVLLLVCVALGAYTVGVRRFQALNRVGPLG